VPLDPVTYPTGRSFDQERRRAVRVYSDLNTKSTGLVDSSEKGTALSDPADREHRSHPEITVAGQPIPSLGHGSGTLWISTMIPMSSYCRL